MRRIDGDQDTGEPQHHSEAEEICTYICGRLDTGIPENLEEFTMRVYKLAYQDGTETAKETVNDWYQPKPY